MRPPKGGQRPWIRYQVRIKRAMSLSKESYAIPEMLIVDLADCVNTLRHKEATIAELDNPAANAIAIALENHAKEDEVQFDEACAANIIANHINAYLNAVVGTGL